PWQAPRVTQASAATGARPGRPPPGRGAQLRPPRRYRSAPQFARVAPHLFGGRIAKDARLREQHARIRTSRPPSRWGYGCQLLAAGWWTSLPWLHLVKAPTLVLAGGDDPLVRPVNARLLAARLPHATMRVVP